MSGFQSAKMWLVAQTGLPRDALHIYAGLFILLGFAALFRLSLRDWRPIVAVLAVTLAGEAWDLVDTNRRGRALAWANSWHDLWNTMLWPTILFLLARFTAVLRR